jgi:hypothetical protein
MSKKRYIYYTFSWLITFLITLLLAVTINYTVDPYGLFDTTRYEGFNRLKPAATSRVRISKPYQVDRIKPRTLIAGNSRPEMGLNPAAKCWPEASGPVYNISLPGAGVYMVGRYIQHAVSGNDVRQVFWGLDFIDFLNDMKKNEVEIIWPPETQAFESRLRVKVDGAVNDKYSLVRIIDYLNSLLSLDSLVDSIYTVNKQSNSNSRTLRRDGFNPAKNYTETMALEGQGLIFKQKNLSLREVFYKPGRTSIVNDKGNSEQFESIRQLLVFSSENNLDVVLFINPYHSDYLSTIQMAGLWGQFLLWKKYLTHISAEFGIPLWDFSGLNEKNIIQPPVIGNTKTRLKWFWEPAHYRKEYGDLMLEQMLGASCGVDETLANGVLLNRRNIEVHLRDSAAEMAHYISEFPLAIERLQKLNNKNVN